MTDSKRLMHSVVFWLRTDAPAGTTAEIAAFYQQRIAPVAGVERVFVGSPAGTDRDVVDSTCQIMSSVVFESEAAATAWQTDPVHDEFRERFDPTFERVIVYDTIEAQGKPDR